MIFSLTLLSLIVPAVTGYFFIAWLLKGDSEAGVIEKVFLGFGAGLGLLTYVMFVFGLLKIPYGVLSITSFLAVISLLFIYLLYRSEAAQSVSPAAGGSGLKGWRLYVSVLIAAWLALKAGFVFYECMTRPLFSWDVVSNWSAGAKFFFYEKGLVLDSGDENFFGRNYRVYMGHPLHSTLVQVWTALWLGSFHEVYVKAWSFFYYLSFLVFFYFAVKRESSTFYALLALFFLSSVPLFTYHGTDAYSELTLGYYGFAATVCFMRYSGTGDRRLISLSGILLAMAVLTKNEGLFFFIAVAGALVLFLAIDRKAPFSDIFYFLLPFILFAGPWFAFKAAHGLGFGHGDPSSGLRWLSDPKFGSDAPRELHWEVFGVIFKQVFLKANFNLVFPFWLLVSAFYINTVIRTGIKYLYFIVLSIITMFLFVYLTLEVTAVTETTGLHRNILTYVPIIFFTCAAVLARVQRKAEKNAL